MQSNSQLSTMPNYVVYLYFSYMAEHNDLGKSGEKEAAHFLRANGFHILSTGYRFGRSEIDIIAKIDNLVVFVEVKTRSTEDFGYPEEFVSQSQWKRIESAANHWIHENKCDDDIRFDIIAISKESGFEHIEDAHIPFGD